MTNNLFKDTLSGIKRERPPVWFMRQAGRVLPAYLKLREKYSFHELMRTPELCCEVTLQPVDELGVDAAILFSDILVIPEALGMKLNFTDKGPVFVNPLKNIENPSITLQADSSKLNYIYDALDIIKQKKSQDVGLIGFCGSPFTTFCYMVEGSSAKHDFANAIRLLYENKEESFKILDKITDLSIEYAKSQVNHGVDCFQLFETHAGLIPSELYIEMILPSVKRISQAVRSLNTPFIYFPKGLGLAIAQINFDIADFVGIDWQYSISETRNIIDPKVGVQGNMDMRILSIDNKFIINKELDKFIPFGRANSNWIFNTGHGLMPDNKLENVKYVVERIKSIDWQRG
ncbi:MAG: uroporphyrinogen decarboxylase [Candidatus Kapabacteria bacterium]|nr:uroporphyrinogen decarboxylase [Candidatus Kapabacteria bacterium]